MSDNPLPTDTIPTTKILETTHTTHMTMGTYAEAVLGLQTLDWSITEETDRGVRMEHPLLPGTSRFIFK